MKYYMHTIDGKPAWFDGDQIVYATHYGKGNIVASTLQQIRKEQKATLRFRESFGFTLNVGEYGYVRVYIPD